MNAESLNMSRIAILVFSQALLCALATYLVSRISLIGKIGVALFYKEYKLLRSGWKTFLLFFGVQLIIILILYLVHRKQPRKKAMLVSGALLVAGTLGLLITYYDFQHTYAHRLLKERFHLGFYLFWLGWMGTCIFFLVTGNDKRPDPGNRQPPAIAGFPGTAQQEGTEKKEETTPTNEGRGQQPQQPQQPPFPLAEPLK